jgi:hypothetical protein
LGDIDPETQVGKYSVKASVTGGEYKKVYQEALAEHKKQANFPGFRWVGASTRATPVHDYRPQSVVFVSSASHAKAGGTWHVLVVASNHHPSSSYPQQPLLPPPNHTAPLRAGKIPPHLMNAVREFSVIAAIETAAVAALEQYEVEAVVPPSGIPEIKVRGKHTRTLTDTHARTHTHITRPPPPILPPTWPCHAHAAMRGGV